MNEEELDVRLVHLLLESGASPLTNGCQTLVDATRRMASVVLPALLSDERDISEKQLSWVFSQAVTEDNVAVWFTEQGFDVVQKLVTRGSRGHGVSAALGTVIGLSTAENANLSQRFVDLLLAHGADVNFNNGAALQMAASKADKALVAKLMGHKPDTASLSLAMYRLFETEIPEDDALELVSLFTHYANDDTRLDDSFVQPGSRPLLFLCLDRYPRSSKLLKALLDAGYFPEQMANYQVMAELEEEPVTLLTWAILQPQKRISSNVIQLLVEKGAKVNFETRLSRTTPLMLAIQARRPDVVKLLLMEGANVDISDVKNNTPLAMATDIGGELSTVMVSNLLAAGAPVDDGSLHNAARELNLTTVQVLVQFGHDPDFPSHLHGGRSALAEICLHAADGGELTAARKRDMEKVMVFLLEKGSDMTLKADKKSCLMLAMDSMDPILTTRTLLKVGFWKHINKPFNYYTDGNLTYSPTMYVDRVMPASDYKEELLALLRANRAEDVFYANSGPQPEDAVGLPSDLEAHERERRARAERLASEREEHQIILSRMNESATIEAQIAAARAQMEDSRRQKLLADEMTARQAHLRADEEQFNAVLRRKRAEQAEMVQHQHALADAASRQAKLIGDAEMEVAEKKQAMLLEWEKLVGDEKVEKQKELGRLRASERADIERLEKASDARFRGQVAEQRRLVESQTSLAGRIANGAGARVGGPAVPRQIGYISGELN